MIAVGNVEGGAGTIYRGRDDTWSRESSRVARALTGVWGWPGNIYVVGQSGNVIDGVIVRGSRSPR